MLHRLSLLVSLLLVAAIAIAAVAAKPAAPPPKKQLDLRGTWVGYFGTSHHYDVIVAADGQGVLTAHWYDLDGFVRYVGRLDRQADGTWLETYSEAEALCRCGPWTWSRDEAGTSLTDPAESWRLLRPGVLPPGIDPDIAERPGQCVVGARCLHCGPLCECHGCRCESDAR